MSDAIHVDDAIHGRQGAFRQTWHMMSPRALLAWLDDRNPGIGERKLSDLHWAAVNESEQREALLKAIHSYWFARNNDALQSAKRSAEGGDRSAGVTRTLSVPAPAGNGDAHQRAVERAQRFSEGGYFTMPGCPRPFCQMTAGEVRAWAFSTGRWVRFAGIVTEGLTDDTPMYNVPDERVNEAWEASQ